MSLATIKRQRQRIESTFPGLRIDMSRHGVLANGAWTAPVHFDHNGPLAHGQMEEYGLRLEAHHDGRNAYTYTIEVPMQHNRMRLLIVMFAWFVVFCVFLASSVALFWGFQFQLQLGTMSFFMNVARFLGT